MQAVIGHVDTLLNYCREGNFHFQQDNPAFQVDLPKLKRGQVSLVVFDVFVEPDYKPDRALERTIQHIDRFYSLLSETEELLMIRDFSDIKKAAEENKIGAVLGLEGAEAFFDLSALRILYHLGVRLFSLTWNQRNALADGIGELKANGGVTELGREVIKEANRLGMVIDVSHLTPKSFWDVIECSDAPVIASHSNASALCSHPRNLDDEQLKAIARVGGHVGINFAPCFLQDRGKAEIKDVVEHIDYIKELIGVECITLGTDYDGMGQGPGGLEDVSSLPALAAALAENGYSREEISLIFKDNWLNLLKSIFRG